MSLFRPAATAMLAACGLIGVARAADHNNLETGFPVVIEDAYTIKNGGLETQGYFRYDRTRGDPQGTSRFSLVPRLEYGATRNLQLTLEAPYRLGTASETKQGEVSAEALYNFNQEGPILPALALGVGVTAPYGRDRGGVESNVNVIATKSLGSIGRSYILRQVSFSGTVFHNYDPHRGERDNRYRVGAVYAQPVTNSLVVLVDGYRETDRQRGSAQNVVEVGGRYQLDPQTVFSTGVGAGIGEQSPGFRAVIGIQRTLSWPFGRP